MFATVYDKITSYLDPRFIFSTFMPSLVFWGLAVLLWCFSGNPWDLIDSWLKQSVGFQLLTSVLFLGWVTFFSLLLGSLIGSLVRTYEGYWEPYEKWPVIGPAVYYLEKTRKKHYQDVLDELFKESKKCCKNDPGTDRKSYEHESEVREKPDDAYPIIYNYYPPHSMREHVMPTRLGNVLKSAEVYPMARYNLDSTLLWPRFYHVLPEKYSERLADAKSMLDMMIAISFLSFLLAAFGVICLLAGKLSAIVAGSVMLGVLLCWVGYQGAVEAGLVYGSLIKSAYDLYRFSLIPALGYKEVPTTLKQEREFWKKICTYMYRGIPTSDPADFPIYGPKPQPQAAEEGKKA